MEMHVAYQPGRESAGFFETALFSGGFAPRKKTDRRTRAISARVERSRCTSAGRILIPDNRLLPAASASVIIQAFSSCLPDSEMT
jgi:hypothetical protein